MLLCVFGRRMPAPAGPILLFKRPGLVLVKQLRPQDRRRVGEKEEAGQERDLLTLEESAVVEGREVDRGSPAPNGS